MSIWDYVEIKNNVSSEHTSITLHEGKTPTDIFKVDNVEVILKREDQNPTGSWKDRATAYKLAKLAQKGVHEGVVYTSGNTGISYLNYIKQLNLDFKLHVVAGSSILPAKLEVLKKLMEGTKHEIYLEDNPKMKSVQISAQLKIPNLKASIDDEALESYWSLGFEIFQLLNKQESNQDVGIFVPTSSGNGFVGLSQGIFIKLNNEYLMPKLFSCQTSRVHPFYNQLKSVEEPSSESLADAIIDSSGLRAPQVLKIVKESSGDVLLVTNEQLLAAEQLAKDNKINDLSYNSLLSLGGFLQVKDKIPFKKVICVTSGR